MLRVMRPQLRPYAPYGIAVLTSAIALVLTWLLEPLMSPTFFALFYPAVMVSSLYGGLRAGLLAIALAALLSKYFFLPPVYSFTFTSPHTLFRFTVLVLVALMIALLSTALRTAKQRTEAGLLKLQRSEEQYRLIVETTNEGIWLIDAQAQTTYVNPRMPQMLGYSIQEMLGRSVLEFIYETDRAEAERLIERRKQGISEQIDFCLRCKDNSPLWVNCNVNAIMGDNGECLSMLAMVTDVSDAYRQAVKRKRTEQRQHVQYAVSRVLAEATTLADAVPTILQSLCESLGWQVGMIWSLDRQANVLRCVETWHAPTVNVEEFAQANRHTTFTPGIGLPGRIWTSGQSAWISDLSEDDNFPRAAIAVREGLRGALGFPILLEKEIIGVIECFSDKIQEPDEDLLQMMASIGSQIGQFMERKRAEEELAENQKLFLSFMNNIPGTAYIKDEQGRYLYTNPVGEKLVNCKLGDLLGKTDFDIVSAEVAQQIRDNDLAVLAAGEPRESLETLPQEDGAHYWMSFKFPIQDASGKQVLAGMSFDITDRKRSEAQIAQLNKDLNRRVSELQTLLEVIPIGIGIALDPECRDIRINSALSEWLNVAIDANASTSQPNPEQLPFKLYCQGKPLSTEEQPMEYAAAHGVEVRNVEADVVRDDGIILHLLGSAAPLFDEEGKVRGCVGAFLDISDRKRTEEALRASETLYRTLSEAVPDFIWSCDAEGRADFVNSRWVEYTGMSLEELNTGGLERINHPDDFPELMQQWNLAKQKGEPFESEFRYRRKDGMYRWCISRALPLKDAAGNIIKWIGTTTDIHERKQAEQALRESESRFRRMADGAPVFIWMSGLDGAYTYFNQLWLDFVGQTLDEALTRGWLEGIHPDDKEYYLETYRSAFNDRKRFQIEYRQRRKDSEYRWLLDAGVPLFNQDGSFAGYIGSGIDISDRKRTEQAQQYLTQASQVLSSSLDYQTTLTSIAQLTVPHLADWCTVHLVEEDGSVQSLATAHVNPAKIAWANQINQKYPLDHNAPRGVPQVLRTGQSELYPDIPDHLLVEAAHDAEHLQILREVGFNSVMIVPLVTGGRTLGTISFIAAESGRRYGSADLVLAEELARRAAIAVENARLYRQAQQARQTAEQAAERTARLQAVTAAFSEALTPGQVTEVVVNQGIAALGVGSGFVALLTENDTSLKIVESIGLPESLIDSWKCFPITAPVPVAEIVRTGQPIFLESVEAFVTKYTVLAHTPAMTGNRAFACIPLTVEGRTLGGMSFSFADAKRFSEKDRAFMLTLGHLCGQAIARARLYEAEQRARTDAEAANRIKDEFLAVLSHELRSPLNPILGWTKLLRSRKFDEKATDRALEIIERNAKLQTQLIEDLLDVSRILRGKLVLNVAPVNLAMTIEGALETVRLAAQTKEIQIQTAINPNVGPVLGDANRLQQVIWNLLSNAVKFTPPRGRVEVSLSLVNSHSSFKDSNALRTNDQGQVTQYAQIQVKDTGKGIVTEFLPHVFEHFRQENSTTTRQFGGLGLGLAIVRYLTELHGGSVFAESPGEGLGATFTVRLPLMVAPQETTQEPVRSHASSDLYGLHILVVDDEADIRELVAFILEESGAKVRIAASAEEALVALSQSVPDVLLSDIGMPGVDGYMLMRQVRALSPERGGQVRAIALTAYAGEYNQQQAIQAGFQMHISKPVEPEDLVSAIAHLAEFESRDC